VRRGGAAATIALLAITAACGSGKGTSGDLLVFAASSLSETFTKIGAGFEHSHKGARVRFDFGPSDGLAAGIAQGARADVFASASEATMDIVDASPGVYARSVFARNKLVVITPKDGTRVVAFTDLAGPGVKLVVAAATAPAGKYTRQMLAKAGMQRATKNIVSNEIDVKSVVQKVVLGEADAGVVYVTDVTIAVGKNVRIIPIPDQVNVVATYPIALVASSNIESGSGFETPHAALARAFLLYVLDPGQDLLRAAGFLPPSL